MRMLLKASIPVEAGNATIKSGTLGSNIESILAEQKPDVNGGVIMCHRGGRAAAVAAV